MSYELALKSFDCQRVLFFIISSFVASVYLLCFKFCLNHFYVETYHMRFPQDKPTFKGA